MIAKDSVQHLSRMPESTEGLSPVEQPESSSGAQPDQQRLARLAFAGVMLSLLVISLMRNVDRYEDLNIAFRYSELIDSVELSKDTIAAAMLSSPGVDLKSLDSGTAGLPDEAFASAEAHGISVIDGRIIATWMKDESDLEGVTYILTPKIERGAVKWSITGTCREKKAC